ENAPSDGAEHGPPVIQKRLYRQIMFARRPGSATLASSLNVAPQASFDTPQKNGIGPLDIPDRVDRQAWTGRKNPVGTNTTLSIAASLMRSMAACSSVSVLASNQAATWVSISGMSGQPNQAWSPLPRIAV